MTPETLSRLRHKAERAHLLKRDSFRPAFLEAMEVIEQQQAVIEQQQAEIERLLKAVADGGLRAGELTGKLLDAERQRDDLTKKLDAAVKYIAQQFTIFDSLSDDLLSKRQGLTPKGVL